MLRDYTGLLVLMALLEPLVLRVLLGLMEPQAQRGLMG